MTFQFTREGIVYRVSSEVGSGAARVIVEEQRQQEQQPLEPSEDTSGPTR